MSFLSSVTLVLFCFGFVAGLLLKNILHPFALFHLGVGSLLFLYAIFTSKNLAKGIRSSGVRFLRLGSSFFTFVLFSIGVYICARNYKLHWDTSEQKIYSLSESTKIILEDLINPLELALIVGPSNTDFVSISSLLQRYVDVRSDLISLNIIDLNKNPAIAGKLNIAPSDRLLLRYKVSEKDVRTRKLASVHEQSVTSAILSFVKANQVIYSIEGHSEPRLADESMSGLSKLVEYVQTASIEMRPLFLPSVSEIPADASALALVSPKNALTQREQDLVESYFNAGGNLILFNDPQTSNSVAQIALNLGIGVQKAVILDQASGIHGAPEIGWQLLLKDFVQHPILAGVAGDKLAVFLIASPLRLLEEYKQDRRYKTFISSSPSSWAERDLSILEATKPVANFDQLTERKGPFPLAVAVEMNSGQRAVVIGDSQWIQNANIDLFSHKSLVTSVMQWGINSAVGLKLSSGTMRFSFMPIKNSLYSGLLMFSFLLPEIIVLLGLLIHYRRQPQAELI